MQQTAAAIRFGQNTRAAAPMAIVIRLDQYRRGAENALATVARLVSSEKPRSERVELEMEAMCWLERHGPLAYGLCRQRIHEAWKIGDHQEAARWQAIREMVARLEGRRIGPGPERE